MAGWVFEYYDDIEEDWVEFSARLSEVTEELNYHEEAVFFIPNTTANRTFVESDQIVRIYFDAEQVFLGALLAVEYSSKELKCIIYNGIYELMKRRVISGAYEAEATDDIMEDVRVAASVTNPLGACPSTVLDMNFDQTLCFDAMVEIAKACNCDYWVQDGDTLYLGTRGSAQSFDATKARVTSRGVDRSKNRDKVHVRGFSADGEELLGVAGSGDDVAVFWNNFATTEDTLDYLAAKLLAQVNLDDSSIKLVCPITEGSHLHPGDTINVTKSNLNLSGSYRVIKIIKTRTNYNIDLNLSKRTTEDILEELSKTRNEVFNFTTYVTQFTGGGEPQLGEIAVGSGYLRSIISTMASGILSPLTAAIASILEISVSPT